MEKRNVIYLCSHKQFLPDEATNTARFSLIIFLSGKALRSPHPLKHIAPSKDLQTIKTRIVGDLLMATINAGDIQRLIKTIKADGTWPGINYVDTSKTGFEHRIHLNNMLDLATAYRKPGSSFYQEVSKKGLVDFVGATTDGEFGVAAFDFKSVHDPLTAKKSWFFFDNEYVGLGTAIQSSAEYPVNVTINHALLHSGVVVSANGKTQTLDKGSRLLSQVSWILHDSVGYLFPSPAAVHVGNQQITGNWRMITHQSWATDEPVVTNIFSAWFDHGNKPSNAEYAYIVLPSTSQTALVAYSKKSGLRILSNTAEIQAVQEETTGLTEVVFYKAGKIKLTDNIELTAKSPSIVMLKMKGGSVTGMTVSDPTQKLSSLQLEINAPFNISVTGGRAAWNKETGISTVDVELPKEGFAGKSVVMSATKN